MKIGELKIGERRDAIGSWEQQLQPKRDQLISLERLHSKQESNSPIGGRTISASLHMEKPRSKERRSEVKHLLLHTQWSPSEYHPHHGRDH